MRVAHKFEVRRYYGFEMASIDEADIPAQLEELQAIGTSDGLVILPEEGSGPRPPQPLPRFSAM